MARDDDAAATLPTSRDDRLLATRRRLVATIVAHPDGRRVGDRAVLGPRERADAALSRQSPEFFGTRSPAGAPLGDRSVSRKEVRVRSRDEAIELDADDASLHVDGQKRARATASEGAVVRLGRVVLVLHASSALPRGGHESHGLVGVSDALERVRDQVDRVGREQVAVLLRGESGVGKELVARAIHAQSTRAAEPFVALNVAALPPGTAAAELFGHARGGYTGAVGEHHGAFGAADHGTLFLDEIGATDETVQSMLLRALDTGEVRQVGARAGRKVDVRVIAATDADLEADIRAGRFSLPLFHRLAGYEIRVPPLRERREDVGALLLHFVREALEASGEGDLLDPARDEPWLPAALVERLVLQPWQGNVRELRNVARQIVIASRGHAAAVLPESAALGAAPPPSQPLARERGLDAIADAEILAALRAHAYEPTAAARALGVSKASMYQLMARCPGVRSAKDLPKKEIEAALDGCSGDLRRAAERLEVSKRALKRRMTDLGM
jgi:two-component system, NtrC family, nitrogen regulation response regulator GlnG